MMPIFEQMTIEQLRELQKAVEGEIKERNLARRAELFRDVVKAMKAFHKEFPELTCHIYTDYVTCDECGRETEASIDIFDCIDQMEDMLRGLE